MITQDDNQNHPNEFEIVEAYLNDKWVAVYWDGVFWRYFRTREVVEETQMIAHWRSVWTRFTSKQ